MQFKVPQDVQKADKIVGPLTITQLIICVIGFSFAYAIYATLQKQGAGMIFWLPPVAIVGAITVAFAFVKIANLPFYKYLALVIERFMVPSKRSWIKGADHVVVTEKVLSKEEEKTVKAKQKSDEIRQEKEKTFTQLTQLSDVLNTQADKNKSEDNTNKNKEAVEAEEEDAKRETKKEGLAALINHPKKEETKTAPEEEKSEKKEESPIEQKKDDVVKHEEKKEPSAAPSWLTESVAPIKESIADHELAEKEPVVVSKPVERTEEQKKKQEKKPSAENEDENIKPKRKRRRRRRKKKALQSSPTLIKETPTQEKPKEKQVGTLPPEPKPTVKLEKQEKENKEQIEAEAKSIPVLEKPSLKKAPTTSIETIPNPTPKPAKPKHTDIPTTAANHTIPKKNKIPTSAPKQSTQIQAQAPTVPQKKADPIQNNIPSTESKPVIALQPEAPKKPVTPAQETPLPQQPSQQAISQIAPPTQIQQKPITQQPFSKQEQAPPTTAPHVTSQPITLPKEKPETFAEPKEIYKPNKISAESPERPAIHSVAKDTSQREPNKNIESATPSQEQTKPAEITATIEKAKPIEQKEDANKGEVSSEQLKKGHEIQFTPPTPSNS